MTWYVVAADERFHADDAIWTLSENPKVPGWITDDGQPGYGLTREKAEALVAAANAAGI